MNKKALQIIAIIGLVFLTAFAVFFTIGLYFRFKEPYNALSLLSLAIGVPMACIVWFFKRREKNTEELIKKMNESEEEDLDSDSEILTDNKTEENNSNDNNN